MLDGVAVFIVDLNPISAPCCVLCRNQSFVLQCNLIIGFYMKCNTELKWVKEI